MALHSEDMSQVQEWGELPNEGWYHVRVSNVEDNLVSKTNGAPMCKVVMKIQEEPYVGRPVTIMPSLQPQALFLLKALYKAAGYTPGPEGHDPEQLIDKEFFVLVEHDVYQGVTRVKVAPYGIRSLMEGKGEAPRRRS